MAADAASTRLGAVRRADRLLVALGLLTLVTGLVDAACYLGLGRVFTANMTGNVVLLAFGAAGTQGLPILGPTVSLLVFLVGAAGGGWLATRQVGPANTPVSASVRRRWLTSTLLIELGLVITAGVAATGLPVDFRLAGPGPRVGRRLAAVGLMAAGALVGALLLRVDVALPVLAAVVVVALAAGALRFGRPREVADLAILPAHDPTGSRRLVGS